MLSMVGAGLHQRYTYLVCGRLIYARDGKPERERDGVEGGGQLRQLWGGRGCPTGPCRL